MKDLGHEIDMNVKKDLSLIAIIILIGDECDELYMWLLNRLDVEVLIFSRTTGDGN